MKRVSNISVFALIAFASMPTALLTGCRDQSTSKTIRIANKSIQSSEITEFLKPVSSSVDGATRDLKNSNSLVLDGTTLTVGPVGGHQTLTIAANSMEMLNGSRIVTNGNNLVLVANEMHFNNSGGIDTFSGTDLKAKLDTAGLDGGQVVIFATQKVTGAININLVGQAGGDGSAGSKGSTGGPGPRGSNGSDTMVGCGSGGGDGGTGQTGGQGTPGNPGAPAGNGGELILRAAAIPDYATHFVFHKQVATGGSGGAGGQGGDGGPGGEGGSGSTYCKGGHGGNPGKQGPQGDQGAPGANGKPSPDPTKDARVN